VAVAAFGLIAFTGDGGGLTSSLRRTPVGSEAPQVTVDVVDNDFAPRHLTIKSGATVTWRFEGNAVHDVTDDGGAFRSDRLRHGDAYVRTFDEPGTYHYYCTLHHAMQGTLVVTP
jgi:plastocyanin